MSSCNTSSNITTNTYVNNITHSGARLLMTLPLSGFSGGVMGSCPETCHGISGGDAIRYDTDVDSVSYQKYVKAQANVAQNAEVIGIVEAVNNDTVDVVIGGQIKYPLNKLVSATHIDPTMGSGGVTGASGGNDVYFLSEVTAGVVQNLAPIETGHIAKPILQAATDNDYTAHVVNYIGYQIGGAVTAEETDHDPAGNETTTWNFGTPNDPHPAGRGWFRSDQKNVLPISIGDIDYKGKLYTKSYETFRKKAGVRYRVEIAATITDESTVLNRQATQKTSAGVILRRWKVTSVDRVNKVLWLEGVNDTDLALNYQLNIGSASYTINDAEITAFFLPKNTRKEVDSSSVDMLGKRMNIPLIRWIHAPADGEEFGVTVSDNLELKGTLTIKGNLNAQNSANEITDVAGALLDIKNALNTVEGKISGDAGKTTFTQFNNK